VLATPGSGDVLAGILGAMMAQNLFEDLSIKMINAVVIHSLCGELCLEESVIKSSIATDILNKIPSAMEILENGYDE
jgi:NAD(P)H-hydrate epimerase